MQRNPLGSDTLRVGRRIFKLAFWVTHTTQYSKLPLIRHTRNFSNAEFQIIGLYLAQSPSVRQSVISTNRYRNYIILLQFAVCGSIASQILLQIMIDINKIRRLRVQFITITTQDTALVIKVSFQFSTDNNQNYLNSLVSRVSSMGITSYFIYAQACLWPYKFIFHSGVGPSGFPDH